MNCKTNIIILSSEVFDDLRSAAWLISEVGNIANLHARHEMADICEKDNVDAVWRMLGIAIAEIRLELMKILELPDKTCSVNYLKCPEMWEFRFRVRMPESKETYLREKIHEYLVARVMADRSLALVPAAADYWKTRYKEAMSAIQIAAASCAPSGRARRPLWPM